MILLGQMIILFILMLVGYICSKTGIITKSGSKVISAVVVNVANPALVLSAGINKEATIQGMELVFTAGLAFGVFAFMMVIGFLLSKILKVGSENEGAYQLMTVFSNIGFMGFPLIQAVYGSEALLYASFFLIPFNILIYTWGIATLTKNKKTDEDLDDRALKKDKPVWLKILNVGVISCILTLIIYIFRIPMPKFIESSVNYLANLTAPLSMMVIGASMTDMDIKSMFTDVKMIIYNILKLIVVPIAGVMILKCIGLNDDYLGVCMVMLATPVASMTVMLAQEYDSNYELVSKGVALSTLLSVGTMPLVSLILGV